MKKLEISIIAGLFLALILSFFADVNLQAKEIRNSTLRLHIIAEDDSEISQEIKLKVKDRINGVCSEILFDAENLEDAISKANENMDYIKQVADYELKIQGADYKSQCSIEKFYFDTTEYENFTMPQGYYNALTIRLGKAQGKNWWCVVYPGLCRSAGGEYKDDKSNTFIETDNFRIKFKAVELWEDFQNLFHEEIEVYDKI